MSNIFCALPTRSSSFFVFVRAAIALAIATSAVPMFIEAGFFIRHKQGIYEFKESLPISNKLTYEIYVESFKMNSGLAGVQGYELLDPYFIFIPNLG